MDLLSQVSDKSYARDRAIVQIIQRFAMLFANVSKNLVLSFDEWILWLLPLDKSLLLKQTFDFVDCDLAFHMAWHEIDNFIFSDSLEVQASDMTTSHAFVCQNRDFLLKMVEKSDRAIWASNSNEVLKSCNRVRHSFCNLGIAMESICNFLEGLLMHKLSL